MSQEQGMLNKSPRAYSTRAPEYQSYRIPKELAFDEQNSRNRVFKSRHLGENKLMGVQNYFFTTKYQSGTDNQTVIQFRNSPKPLIENRLHLDFPRQRKVQVKNYVGQEKQFQLNVTSMFTKFFKSCMQPKTEQDFKECDYCEHRYYNDQEKYKQREKESLNKQLTQPYMSYRRLLQRQKQPVQIFYKQITNQPIKNNRWQSSF